MADIKEIQNAANDNNVDVSVLLRKAKLIASELKQKSFIDWIDKELNGYSKNDKVPEYRIVKGIPQGFNPYRGWVPYIHTDAKSQEIISQRGIGQSVGQLEEILKSKGNHFEVKFPPDIAKLLREGIQMEVDLRLTIDRSEVSGILEHIRNAILDWSIELQKKGVPNETSKFTKQEIMEADDIKPKYQIQHIEHFEGSIGESNNFKSGSGSIVPQESFWTKFLWYVIIALIVLVVGNIISALILKFFFAIG